MGFIFKTYAIFLSRRIFIPIHKRICLFGLRGLGMLNSENLNISGERYILNYLKSQKIYTIFNVGANAGQYASLIREKIPSYIVFSLEPNPVSFENIKKLNLSKHLIFNIGLGKENGQMILYDYKSAHGSEYAALNKEIITVIHQSEFSEINVSIARLDYFYKNNDVQEIDFLKINVEGFEYDVLLGCGHFLKEKKIKFIQFEFNANYLISKNSLRDYEKLLQGYTFYRSLQGGLHPLANEKSIFKEIFLFQNIFTIGHKKEQK